MSFRLGIPSFGLVNPPGRALAEKITQIIQNGVTFNLAGSGFEAGQDAAGDWWVYNPSGAITDVVSEMLPASEVVSGSYSDVGTYTNRTVNGAMVNPGATEHTGTDLTHLNARFGSAHGWDSTPGENQSPPFDAAKNRDPVANSGTALSLKEGTILKAISNLSPESSGRGSVKTYVPLTVVTQKPAKDAILGQPWTTTQALQFKQSDIDLSILPRLPVPAGQTRPNIQELIDQMKHSRQYHWTNANEVRAIHPTDPDQDWIGYGGQGKYARLRGRVLMALTLDYTDEELLELATLVVREGICIARRVSTGGVWEPNGGLNSGRLPILIATARLLNNSDMLAMVDREGTYGAYDNKQRWHEYGQIFPVDKHIAFDKVDIYDPGLFYTGTDSSATGYAVGDKVRLTGGAPYWPGEQREYEITSVDATGKVKDWTVTKVVKYHSQPTGVQTVTGVGSGLALRYQRSVRIYNDGLIGIPEWATNVTSTANNDPANAHFYDSYRLNNRGGNIGTLMGLRNITGAMTAMNASIVFDYHDRSYFMPDSGLAEENFTAFEKAYWNDHRDWVDPTPGAPTVSTLGAKDNVVWIKYNKPIREGDQRIPAGQAGRFLPATADFTVKVNGTAATVIEAAVNYDTISLYLDSFLAAGDTVTASYTKGTAPDVVTDWAGNEGASFTDQAVTNHTTTYTNPVPNSLIANSDFYREKENWTGSMFPVALDADDDIVLRFPSDVSSSYTVQSDRFAMTTSDYTFRMNVKGMAPNTTNKGRFEVLFYDSAGTYLGYHRLFASQFTIPGNGIMTDVSRTPPAGTAEAYLRMRKYETPVFDIDWVDLAYTV